MAYSRYYPNGWADGESGGTPITAAAMNHIEDGLVDNGTLTQLTITRTANSYIDATNTALLKAVRKGGFLWFNGNINLSSTLPTGTGLTEIAKISGWSSDYTISATAGGQNGGGVILVSINTSGTVQIANTSGTAAVGFHRCPMVAPATD